MITRQADLRVSLFVDQDAEDEDAAARVAAILRDNGETVADVEPATGPSVLTGAPMWARQLAELLAEMATAQRAATVTYAEAYLAAEGTQQYRAASADLAAAAAVEAHATLAGRAEAYRMVLADRARRDAHSEPAPWPEDRPRCIYWWHDTSQQVHRCALEPGHPGQHKSGAWSAPRGGGA